MSFMKPLVEEMTRKEPDDRPTIQQVVQLFEKLQGSLSQWRLRSRYVYRDELFFVRPFRAVRHTYRTVGWIVDKKSAIPAYEAHDAPV